MINHENHISIDVMDYPSVNGVLRLRFPPYCSHKLQSLDQMVYGPIRRYRNSVCDNWMLNHPRRTMTMHDILEFISHTFPKAMTPNNIEDEFRVARLL